MTFFQLAPMVTKVGHVSWKHTDTPMLLHVFEHIARNVLLSWWKSMLATNKDEGLAESGGLDMDGV